MQEFGLEIPASVQVQVWDSNADLRYLVLPERPKGTEGMTEETLAALVTRNAMIGTDKILPPKLPLELAAKEVAQ